MKKQWSSAIVLLVLIAVMALPAAATVFEGQGMGYGGPITVAIEVDGNVLVSVTILSHSETPILSDAALQQIPRRVVENQSLDVDTIAGATQSSRGVLEAIAAALDAAGVTLGAVDAEVEEVAGVVVETDIVVVGAGGAGLAAAIEGAAAGADVVVLEKLAFAGGETLISAGGLQAGGSFVQEEAGIEDSAADLYRYWMRAGLYKVDSEWASRVAGASNDNLLWLTEQGVEFTPATLVHGSWSPDDPRRFHMPTGGGSGLVGPLVESAERSGVKFYYETEAVELIVEDGRVVGVRAEGAVDVVRASSVIIATGGFGANADLFRRFAPEFAEAVAITTPGNMGGGLLMAMEVGAKTSDIFSAIGWPTAGVGLPNTILVNSDGKRFIDENIFYALKAHAMLTQKGPVYQVFDQSFVDGRPEGQQTAVANGVEAGTVWKADSVEALAEALGLPAAQLAATMDEFNAMAAAGEDTLFWRDGNTLMVLDQGPFYAQELLLGHLGSIGGIIINENAQVLHEDGSVIPGLYAAGSVTGGFVGEVYPGSGTAIAWVMVTGRIAGSHAAGNR